MKTYNKQRFKQIMVAIDAYNALRNSKQSFAESFTDVIRRLIKLVQERQLEWSVVRSVEPTVKEFYRSELFG